MTGDHPLCLHAREKAGMGDDWHAYLFKALPMEDVPTQVFEITGSAARRKTRGKYKGDLTWKGADRRTRRTVYITPAEHDAWCAARPTPDRTREQEGGA